MLEEIETMLKHLRSALVLAALFCGLAPAAMAQDAYPTRTIKLISPYEPGGGTDVLARLVAQGLGPRIGQSVVVENRPGAGGTVGTATVVNSAPDGYTLLLASPSPIVVMPYMLKHLSYDPFKDLAPVTLISDVPALLVVNPSIKVDTVADLIALAKAQPGKLTFSSSGNGGTAHLAGEMLKLATGIDMLHVPYKGTGPANTALLKGEVSMSFSDVISTLHYVQSGQLKAIAVTTPKRSEALPNVPSIAETIPGYNAGVWYGILAPAKTPQPIIDKLNREIVALLHTPEFQAKLKAQGAQVIGDTPAEFSEFLKADAVRWSKVIRDAHMTVD
jgi:tripartite-type tricarboxylate transporter receptor subunit TctC